MDMILRNTQYTSSVTFYQDESATSGTDVAVVVTNDAGTEIATGAAVDFGGGQYAFNVDPQTDLDVLTLAWTGTFVGYEETLETQVEVVGSFIASVSEIRSIDTVFADTDKYTYEQILEAQRTVTSLFERYCGRNFVQHYTRDVVVGDGTDVLYLPELQPRRILGAAVDGEAVDTDGWTVAHDGTVINEDDVFTCGDRYDIRYESGMKTVPAEIKRAFLKYIRHILLDKFDRVDDRVLNMNVDGTYMQLAVPSLNRPTGIPEVDAILNNWKATRASVVGGWGY